MEKMEMAIMIQTKMATQWVMVDKQSRLLAHHGVFGKTSPVPSRDTIVD
jgi:hypothetical protein